MGVVLHSGNQHQLSPGRRKTGRPRKRWRRDLVTDTKRTGYSWRELRKKPMTADFGGGKMGERESDDQLNTQLNR